MGIDPADAGEVTSGFGRIAGLITSAANVSLNAIAALKAADQGDEEAVASVRQKYVVEAMLAAAQKLAPGYLAPIAKAAAATLGEHWDRLGPTAQQMLVTAEYFGLHAPVDADHSGPLLGLAVACEATKFDYYLIDAASAANPKRINTGATLGKMIRWANDATYPNNCTDEAECLRDYLTSATSLDLLAVRDLVPKLKELNVGYRIPAAHREVVSQCLWAAGRSLILDPTSGVVARLVAVCAPPIAVATDT